MKHRFYILSLLLMLFSSQPLFAFSVSATLDQTEGTLQDYFQLTIAIADLKSNASVGIEVIRDFQIGGRSTGQNMSYINGAMKRTQTLTLTLIPSRVGTLKIPKIPITVAGVVKETTPLTVIVKTEAVKDDKQRDLFLDAKLSDARPYVGQQIVYTLFYYSAVQSSNAQLDEPKFARFKSQAIKENRNYRRVVKGRSFNVIEVNRILIPQKTGQVKIDNAVLTTDVPDTRRRQRRRSPFGNFFGDSYNVRSVRLVAPALNVNVRPLPRAGRPVNFMDLVGRVSMAIDYNRGKVSVGDSVTLTITVKGDTDLEGIALPPVPPSKQYKTYVDKANYTSIVKNNRILAQKVFKVAIVPIKPGRITLPAFEIPFFDPKSGRYRKATSAAIVLNVQAGDGSGESLHTVGGDKRALKSEIKVQADDILSIHENIDALNNHYPNGRSLLLQLLFPLCSMLFFFTVLWRQHQHRFKRNNRGRIRADRALKTWMHKIDAEGNRLRDPLAVLELCSQTLKGYVSDKLAVNANAFTAAEIETLLSQKGIHEATKGSIRQLLERVEMAQYGGADAGDSTRLVDNCRALITALNKQL